MMQTLSQVRTDVVARLHAAARDRTSPMHTPVVATADADARIMVLREFDAERWMLRFHTDARAPKVSTIDDAAQVAVLFYDKSECVQLRCRGRARIERDTPLADAAWSSSDNYARRCYLGSAPGETVEGPSSGLPEWIEGKKPTDEQLAPVRSNFAVLLIEIEEVDWYRLAHDGHRRAIVGPLGDGRWLTP